MHKYVQGVSSGEPFDIDLDNLTTGIGLLDFLGIPKKEAFVFMVNGSRIELVNTLQEGGPRGDFPASRWGLGLGCRWLVKFKLKNKGL